MSSDPREDPAFWADLLASEGMGLHPVAEDMDVVSLDDIDPDELDAAMRRRQGEPE